MEYRAKAPNGRAFLHGAEYTPPHEEPDDDYPLCFTTGRTSTTSTPAPRPPARRSSSTQRPRSGSRSARVTPPAGARSRATGFASNPARATSTPRCGSATSAPALVFAPFHYGYFDQPEGDQPATHPSAANELTLTEWDPVSKQPYFKFAAVRVTKLHDTAGHAAPAPTNTGSAPSQATQPRGTPVPEPTTGGAAAESESTTQGS